MANGITPGKLFEYLATKNQILALGPNDSDVNRIITECKAGATFNRTQKNELIQFLTTTIRNKIENKVTEINETALHSYSRKEQAKKIQKPATRTYKRRVGPLIPA